MVAVGLFTMLGESVKASSASPALIGCATCATLWVVIRLVIQEIRTRAIEGKIRQGLRLYLHNCQGEVDGQVDADVGPEPEMLQDPRHSTAGVVNHRLEPAQADSPCVALGFKDIDCAPTRDASEGLVVFDAIPPRCGPQASRGNLALPGCLWQVLPNAG